VDGRCSGRGQCTGLDYRCLAAVGWCLEVTDRQNHIVTLKPINQELTAKALRKIAYALDQADEHVGTYMGFALSDSEDIAEVGIAWMWAALLIADTREVDSVTLRSLANSIFKGVQGEL